MPAKTHGMGKTNICKLWMNMRYRCHSPKHKLYKNYGARGIYVCERWQNFINFYADMGDRPDGYVLDRIDNDGPYSPENCRWATMKESGNNRRSCRYLTMNGETKSVTQWCDHLNIPRTRVYARVKLGWSYEEALTTQLHKQIRSERRLKILEA